jgi:hypothetical protein
MSQPINNITIAHVPNDRAVIAIMLEYLGLLKCKKMCVMPDFQRNQLCYSAYIEVAEWCDREAAYNLIRKIKDPRKEARIVYEDDNWWTVEETTEADLCFTQGSGYERWTTIFKETIVLEEPALKQVSFKTELEHSMTIEDMDMRLECKYTEIDFNAFCIGFGLAYGYDFEAEFKAWTEAEEAEADKRMVDDIVLEMGF